MCVYSTVPSNPHVYDGRPRLESGGLLSPLNVTIGTQASRVKSLVEKKHDTHDVLVRLFFAGSGVVRELSTWPL